MRHVSALAGITMAACFPAAAQTVLSAKEAVALALRAHPLLSAGTERIAAATALVTQAGLRPNPRASVQTENWRPYGSPSLRPGTDIDTYAFLTQPIETAGKRTLRRDLAEAGVRRSELERDLLARQIAARVRFAYWTAAGAEKVRLLWLENARTFRQIIDYHELRVREGAMAEADLLKVRLEGARLEVAANGAALEAERARIQLFREMGQTEFPQATLSDPLDLAAPPAGDAAAALAARVEVRIARQAVEQARANLRLQQAVARPDVDAVVGYKRTSGFHTALAGVQIALPFSSRNQGNIGAAEAGIRVLESERAAVEALVKAEVEAARREVELRRGQLTGLLKDSLARAGESSRIAQAAYREGGADLLRLLDAERVRIELEVQYYRTLAEYRQSVVALETALGVTE